MGALARSSLLVVLLPGLALGADARRLDHRKGEAAEAGQPTVESPLKGKGSADTPRIRPGQQPPGRTGPERACWCCADGEVALSSARTCVAQGGTCEEGTQEEAVQRCDVSCWCCAAGQVSRTRQFRCQDGNGECVDTRTEAERICRDAGQ
jgi:hypothetical protein